MAGGRFELAMEPTAIGLGSLDSNSETHMTAICDARLIYGRGWISRVFICNFKVKIGLYSRQTDDHQIKGKDNSSCKYVWLTKDAPPPALTTQHYFSLSPSLKKVVDSLTVCAS